MKVSLTVYNHPRSGAGTAVPIRKALPIYRSERANNRYYHRVRYMNAYWRNGEIHHTAVEFMCGNHAFVGESRGRLYPSVPEGGELCRRCSEVTAKRLNKDMTPQLLG